MPELLSKIAEGNDAALDGLRQIVTVKPNLVQTLIPKLVGARAITLAAVKCVAVMASVADVDLSFYVNSLVPGFFLAFDESEDVTQWDELMEYTESCLVAIGFEMEDVGILVNELHRGMKKTAHYSPSDKVRKAACELLQSMYGESVPMEQEHHIDSLEILMSMLDHEDQEVRLGAWNAISTYVIERCFSTIDFVVF